MAVKTVDLGKVVGRDAYLGAVAAGYTGTEAQFYTDLAALGDVKSVLNAVLNGTGGTT